MKNPPELPENTHRPATSWTTQIPTLSRESGLRYGILLLLALLLTLIILPHPARIPADFSPGDIAAHNIKASRDLLLEDRFLTEKKRSEAYDQVEFYYDFDSHLGEDLVTRLQQAGQSPERDNGEKPAEPEHILGFVPNAEEMALLQQLAANDVWRAALRRAVVVPYNALVVENLATFQGDRDKGVVFRDLQRDNLEAPLGKRLVIDLHELRGEIMGRLAELRSIPLRQRRLLSSMIEKILRPNLTFNRGETELRRKAAVEAVNPALFQVKRGEMLVREGERLSEEQLRKLKAIAAQAGDHAASLRTAVGLTLLTILLFFTVHRFGKLNIRKYRPNNRDLLFLAIFFTFYFLLVKVALVVSATLDAAFPAIEPETFYYLFPFAVGAMVVRIVLNSEVALIFNALATLLLAIQFGAAPILLYVFIGGVTAAHRVRHCKERSVIYRAGLHVGLVNACAVLFLALLAGRSLNEQTLWGMVFGFFGGIVCAAVATAIIPVIESLFRYTTDIKLLELANMNNPLLRELMVQAPGTYHHSVIVGNLVEAAAESINANPLLAKVAAYYHDIGKIKKPLYFSENMRDGENRHDKLAPSMSALIIAAHVRDGLDLAKEHQLGAMIKEVIQQHHGTAQMRFFYDKAKQLRDADLPPVDEHEFRYPGPKPQTREAALIMLADAVEAASRTLPNPTPARIQGLVQKIINYIFTDGQLDECELTLKDLHLIAKSFNLVLAGIYHHRIDYPEPAFKETQKRKSSEHSDRESAKETENQHPSTPSGRPEDIKRLGMS
jgi:putative nucleotidyltransferase with HDIG domain